MKLRWKYLIWFFAFLFTFAAITGAWFYFEIWVPNRILAQSDWWQHDYANVSHEKVRSLCHEILSHRIGNHHDAFVALGTVGNRDSIPYLIRALEWQEGPDSSGMLVCTTAHCTRRLWELTGMWFDLDHKKWKQWWEETGRHLSPEQLQKKAHEAANKASEATSEPAPSADSSSPQG